MTILVIGATGFLGRHIVEKLQELEKKFVVLTRDSDKLVSFSPKVQFIIGDLLDLKNMDLSSYQYIINCSGEINNTSLMRSLHVDAIQLLLNKIKKTPHLHWIQISSVGVYGKIQEGIVTEHNEFFPVGEYELTKAESELIIKQFCTDNNIHYTIIRPSIIFGVGMPNKSLSQLISMIQKKLFFYIGKDTHNIMMNYIHVKDVANFVVSCLENSIARNNDFIISECINLPTFVKIISEAMNINSSFLTIPEKYARMFAKLTKVFKTFPLKESRIDALTNRTIYCAAKAEKDMQFIHLVGIENGLKSFCNHIESTRS